MPKKPNLENQRKVLAVEALLAKDKTMTLKKACETHDINISLYRSYMAKRKEREEEAKSWAYIKGKQA